MVELLRMKKEHPSPRLAEFIDWLVKYDHDEHMMYLSIGSVDEHKITTTGPKGPTGIQYPGRYYYLPVDKALLGINIYNVTSEEKYVRDMLGGMVVSSNIPYYTHDIHNQSIDYNPGYGYVLKPYVQEFLDKHRLSPYIFKRNIACASIIADIKKLRGGEYVFLDCGRRKDVKYNTITVRLLIDDLDTNKEFIARLLKSLKYGTVTDMNPSPCYYDESTEFYYIESHKQYQGKYYITDQIRDFINENYLPFWIFNMDSEENKRAILWCNETAESDEEAYTISLTNTETGDSIDLVSSSDINDLVQSVKKVMPEVLSTHTPSHPQESF